MMKVLDLFSGIGGFSLGLERAGMETIAFCEINSFCQKVLKKHWPEVPIYEDVKTINKQRLLEYAVGLLIRERQIREALISSTIYSLQQS